LAIYTSFLKRNGWLGKTSIETGFKDNILQNQPKIKTQKQPLLKIETKVLTPKPEIQEAKNLETDSSDEPNKNKSLKENIHKKLNESQNEKPAGCNYYLGYLWTFPKDKSIPDECYCCSKLIECYK
jgi:hypothetical protein